MPLGHLGPSPDLVDHSVGEQRLDFVRIRAKAGVLILRHPDRIRSRVRDRLLDRLQFGLGQVVAGRAGESGLVPTVSLLHNRGDRFGGQIPSHEEGVDIIERGRRQELAKRDLRTMEIGREEEAFELPFRAFGRHRAHRTLGPAP